MLRNVKFMISSRSCSMIRQIMCQLRKLISKEEYLNLRESIEFPSNSTGKSHVLGCKSTSVAAVVFVAISRRELRQELREVFDEK